MSPGLMPSLAISQPRTRAAKLFGPAMATGTGSVLVCTSVIACPHFEEPARGRHHPGDRALKLQVLRCDDDRIVLRLVGGEQDDLGDGSGSAWGSTISTSPHPMPCPMSESSTARTAYRCSQFSSPAGMVSSAD